jgi:hypothetical protein
MFEEGNIVFVSNPKSVLFKARARIISPVPGTSEYFVEIINEDLLMFEADKHDKRARFHESELTIWEDLDIGSVVTVIDAPAEYYIFGGFQGQIIGYDPEVNEFLVLFHPEHVDLLPHNATDEQRQKYFTRSQLRKDDNWIPENEAVILFGKGKYYHLNPLEEKFVPGSECMHEGCNNPIVRRCMVNIHGTLHQHDLCHKHAQQYHGKRIPGPFPNKPPKQQAKAG